MFQTVQNPIKPFKSLFLLHEFQSNSCINFFSQFQVFFVLSASIALAECAKLLRKPKVYNAVITTDENLTPSRAYPIIQPVIQPAYPVLSPYYPTTFFNPYNPSLNDVNNGRIELKVNQEV